VILSAGFSRTRILGNYAKVEQTHGTALHGYDAFITQISPAQSRTDAVLSVRIGAPDRSAASTICNRIGKNTEPALSCAIRGRDAAARFQISACGIPFCPHRALLLRTL